MSRADPHISVLGAITITKRESGEEDCIQVYFWFCAYNGQLLGINFLRYIDKIIGK